MTKVRTCPLMALVNASLRRAPLTIASQLTKSRSLLIDAHDNGIG
jgi:hypothetical protein